MKFIRAVAVSALALFAFVQTAEQASADHRFRMRVLWPKIYAPRLSGYLYRDEYADEEDGFFDPEDPDVMIPRRQRYRDRNVVLDYDADEFDPIYEPPVKKKPRVIKKKTKKAAVEKKNPVKPAQTAAAAVKPKVKPGARLATTAPASQSFTAVKTVPGDAPIIAKTGLPSTAIKPLTPLPSSAVKAIVPQTVAPKSAAKTVPSQAKTQLATTGTATGSIGCSKGAEIVSGYGFTSVKPRSCTGSDL